MIPLLHDFSGTTVLVFGGGRVGARKARRFAREARVVVVSPAFAEADFGGAERVRAAPTSDEVPDVVRPGESGARRRRDGRRDLNDAVARTAHERGSLLNRADRSRRATRGR